MAGGSLAARRIDPRVGKFQAPCEIEQPTSVRGVARAHDLKPYALKLLEQFTALDEGAQNQVRQRRILEQELPEHFPIDLDVAHRLGHNGREEHGLAGEQVDLAEEPGGSMAHDLLARPVHHRRLTLDDRDERIRAVADLIESLSHLGAPLLAVLGECRELRAR
jgi:hypothetical protein